MQSESLKKRVEAIRAQVIGEPLEVEIKIKESIHGEVIEVIRCGVDELETINDKLNGKWYDFRVLDGNNIKDVDKILLWISADAIESGEGAK